jgi:CDP-glycerol glycerophosphotransferase (TagB/SpsB family)
VLPYVGRWPGRTVALTSFHGRGWRGNPRVLFEALLARGRVDPVWLTTDPALGERIAAVHGSERVALTGSPEGDRVLARAKVVVLSHGTSDLPDVHINRRATVLQSWHGLPTKTGELMGGDLGAWDRTKLRARWQAVDFMLSSSPLVSQIYAARFGLRTRQMLELGYPDHDRLCRTDGALDSSRAFAEAPPHRRVVLYAPTFRKQATTRLLPFADLDLPGLERALADLDAIVALRPHPNDRLDAQRLCAASPRFVLADDRRIEDVVPLVLRADAIVTDYSGIFLDGLLSDTPCVFVPYDLAEYERGIPWDYATLTPGPKVATQAEFTAALRRALVEPGADGPWRAQVRAQFFTRADGRATERVCRWIEDVVTVYER